MLKYHVSLDSLWPQIREHTHRNSVTAALYYNGVEVENLSYIENGETTENRQAEKAITEATLIVDGLLG